MRPIVDGEFSTLTAPTLGVHLRVEILDSDGIWQDLTARGRVVSVTWSDDIDQAVMSGTLVLDLGAGADSLAPLMEASALNRNLISAYIPLLNPGRRLRITTAEVPGGTVPGASDWHEVLLGNIDTIDPVGSRITVPFRDIGAELQNTQIEEARPYGAEGGVLLETVIQAILDDNSTGVTLYVPESPGWYLKEYEQDTTSNVLDAIRALALQIGWDVRYRYDAVGVFRLTLYQVARDLTEPMATFTPLQYLDVMQAELSAVDVRNVIKVTYPGGAAPVVREDAISIAIFGRRFMAIGEDLASNIDTLAEAEALADFALSDLSNPTLSQTVENLYFWPVELGDLYAWAPNGVQYDSEQQLAVVGYTHTLQNGSGRTTMRCRGKPAGAYRRWMKGELTFPDMRPEVSAFDYRVNELLGIAEVFGTVNPLAKSLRWWLSDSLDAYGADPVAASPGLITGLDLIKQFSFSFSLPDGKGLTLSIQPYPNADGSGAPGLLYEVYVARSPRTELRFEPRDPTGRIRSDWARVTFSVRPTIPAYVGGDGTGTLSGSTVNTLTDGTKDWTPGQFAYDPASRRFYYVRVGEVLARIIDNTSDTLTVAPDFTVAPTGVYAIYEGATLYSLIADGLASAFLPVSGPLYIQRAATDVVIEFYSELNGTAPEPVKRFTFDPDEMPELTGIEAQEVAPNRLNIRVKGYDDDTKLVKVYARKGAYPTVDGSNLGVLDEVYKRYDDVASGADFIMDAGTGTWYIMAVPVNSYNDIGPAVFTSVAVTGVAAPGTGGVPTPADALSSLLVTALEDSGSLYHKLSWAHTDGLSSPSTDHELKVYGYRSDEGVGAKRLLTSVGRRAWQDSGAGFDSDPDDDADVTAMAGSVQLRAGDAGTVFTRTWYYTVELWVSGVLQATYSLQRTDTYGVADDVLSLTVGRVFVSTYGGKPYVNYVFDYGASGPDGSFIELWEASDVDDFGAAHMQKRVKYGQELSMTRLLDAPPYNAGEPVTQWYYWVRKTDSAGNHPTPEVGSLNLTYELP